ncbi:MAG: LacI family DNA-binding transcriptional regulator [Anaerovoracaceae bacterium]
MNIKEVAEKAGVSITTVSRVLNNPDMVSEITKKKILSVMDELNYTPNWFARNLQNTRTNVIGMLIPDTLDPSNMNITKGVEKIARQKNNNIILCNTEYDYNTEKDYIKTLTERKIDGLILTSTTINKEDIQKLKAQKIPFVLIGKTESASKENMVHTNYDTATEEAVEYLIGMGRKNIAIILSEYPETENNEKLSGFKNALKKHKLKLDTKKIIVSENTIEGGYVATSKLLEGNEIPDAVFICTDTMAFGAIERIKKEGLTPEQIAIIGFDDLKVGAVMEPKLTTVTKPSYRIGLTAARLLFDLIEDKNLIDEPQTIILQSRLKIRKSCGNKERLKEIW